MAALRSSFAIALSLLVSQAACLGQEDGPGGVAFDQVKQEVRADRVCTEGPTLFGIDVSRFQGSMDWQKVADAGVVYAWIQISRDFNSLDPTFEYNWRRAKEVGILRGAYQRFSPGRDVAAQAQLFLDTLGPFQAGDLPPMVDVEDADGMSAAAIENAVREWIAIVESATGVKPIIYTGYYFWQDSVGNADFTDYPLWAANYVSAANIDNPTAECPLTPRPWETWTIWQYSSSVVMPGITENTVDVNLFQGTLEDLHALGAPPVCGDAICSGSETSDSCLEDCAPCQIIGAEGGIVDDASECFAAGGSQEYIRQEAAGHEGGLKWTHATDAAQASNYGQWDLYFEEAGRYRLEAFTPAPFGQSRQAIYQVSHAGESVAAEVDQSAVDGWSLVADLDFAAGGGQSIRVDDNTGEANETNTKIVFDAVRLTRLDAPIDDGDDEDGDDGDDVDPADDGNLTSGCAAGGSGGPLSGLLLLAAIAVVGRRRRG